MHITMDGISTDSAHRALDATGNVVPGLYVVGEAACGGAVSDHSAQAMR